jgi:hypothetical protein
LLRLLGATLASFVLASHALAQAPAPAPAPPAPAPPPVAPPPAAPPPAAAPPAQYGAPPPQYGAPPPQYGAPPPQYGAPPPQYAPGYPPPGYPPPGYPPVSHPPRPSKGLMISGIAVLGGSYLVAMLIGTILLDEEATDTCIDCDAVGPLLFIPVVGPFVAMGPAVDGEGALALLGAIEVVGLGLMIGGIIRYVSTKRAAQAQGYYGLSLPEGRSLSLDFAATPARFGPTLKLHF